MPLDYFIPTPTFSTVTIEPDGDGGVVVTIPLGRPPLKWESFGLGLALFGITVFLKVRLYLLPAYLLQFISAVFVVLGSIHLAVSVIRRARAHPSAVLGITKESVHIDSPGFLSPNQIHAPRVELQHVEATYRRADLNRRTRGVAFHFLNRSSVFIDIERIPDEARRVVDALSSACAATATNDVPPLTRV